MCWQWIFLFFLSFFLVGCMNYDNPVSADHPRASPCKAIQQQLNAIDAPQLRTRQTAIQQAKLLRDYEHYNCQN